MHPDDAEAHGLADGDTARVASKSGAVEVPVLVTDEMTPGTVALPHGWGHRGGWSLANAAGGVNVNLLSSAGARGPRAAGRHGLPERDPGQPRAGRVRGARTVSPSRRRASSIAAVSGVVPVRSASSKISLSVSPMPRTRARARLGS